MARTYEERGPKLTRSFRVPLDLNDVVEAWAVRHGISANAAYVYFTRRGMECEQNHTRRETDA